MEAVGQLTGGVAHDFNNLLAVIMGNMELLEEELNLETPALKAVLRAVERGSELTQRLLAYSRQQTLMPQKVDLAALVSGMTDLLTRTLGATVEIEIIEAPDLWLVSADPGQVENAILNLALNARDAVPDGGKLTIECRNEIFDAAYLATNPEAIAGEYACLSVTDNGVGMSEEVQSRAFEPFFTTKEVGEGSGLGLSMVYGFATQSGGHVAIYSEEGVGTTVKLNLPRAMEVVEPVAIDPANETAPVEDVIRGGNERVLIIEDDPDLRPLTVRILQELGYTVVAAQDAAEAGLLLEKEAVFDLVLSDVVLPGGVSGPQFAQNIHGSYPNLKFIFMSGYPAEAATRNGLLEPGDAQWIA